MKDLNGLPFRRRKKDEDPSVLALQVQSLLSSGGGSGGTLVYNTLTDLQNAYPGGSTQPAWVIADNEWYYWSGTIVADTTAPNNVTNLTTSNVTQTTLSLSWTVSTSTDIASYDIYKGSTLLGNVTASTYNVTGLTAGTSYTFTVKAKDTSGNVASGTSVTISTTALTPPANVTNLVASNIANTTLSLSWTASSGATSYDVYNGATLLGNTSTTNYSVTGLISSTQYTFKVVAKNSGGSSTGVTTTVSTTSTADTTPPNPVTNLVAGTLTSSTIPVTWTLSSSPDVANYEVAYSSDGGTNYNVASGLVNASSTSYTVTGLIASTAYIIRVVAIDGAGNRSTPVTVNATTAAPADTTPPTVTASPAAGTFTSTQTITLSANETATIYYTTDGTTPTYPISGTTQTYSTPISISATTTLKYIGRDTAGNVSAVQSQVYTINAPVTYASDDFNRADNSTTLGGSWNVLGTATFGISANQAFSSGVTGDALDVWDTTHSDNIAVEADLPTVTASKTRLVWRVQDVNNFYLIQAGASTTSQIYKKKAGSFVSISTTVSPKIASGDHVRVELTGSTHKVYVNGSLAFTFTDTDFQTATMHGIGTAASDTGKWDNFKVSSL